MKVMKSLNFWSVESKIPGQTICPGPSGCPGHARSPGRWEDSRNFLFDLHKCFLGDAKSTGKLSFSNRLQKKNNNTNVI